MERIVALLAAKIREGRPSESVRSAHLATRPGESALPTRCGPRRMISSRVVAPWPAARAPMP